MKKKVERRRNLKDPLPLLFKNIHPRLFEYVDTFSLFILIKSRPGHGVN